MSGKKSTATVTWISWNNYGSLLQAYALQKTIQRLGCSNVIIDDGPVASGSISGLGFGHTRGCVVGSGLRDDIPINTSCTEDNR